jgi:hypothetical protein
LLKAFLAVVKEKGFSAAARRLKLLKGGHLEGDTVVDLCC